jgi:Response regulators consisting of a CheY-like receiver domain and a winged-helix DNA-binding domain
MAGRVLFVEDDNEYRTALADIFRKEGYEVDDVETPIEAIENLADQTYDLVVSDLLMEEMNGVRLLKYVKKANPNIQTIILTASPNIDNQVEVIDVDIDKYFSKDVRIDILLKYIEYLIAFPQKGIQKKTVNIIYDVKESVELNSIARTIKRNNKNIAVTYKEFGIIKLLLERKGEAISRQEIIKEVWDNRYRDIDARVIDVHIKSIRKKLRVQSIVSIRGFGYKWEE